MNRKLGACMELGLGTVQFGIDYGVANKSGKVSPGDVAEILETAGTKGIHVLDTATGYGDSEEVLGAALPAGHSFGIVTKLPSVGKNRIGPNDIAELENTVASSLEKLRTIRVDSILLHRPLDLLLPGGELLYEFLCSLKNRGTTRKTGVSVYDGDEIDSLFGNYEFDVVQAPLNVLDQRLVTSGHLTMLNKRNIEIHVRSVFLQGLLVMPLLNIPEYFIPIRETLKQFREFTVNVGLSPLEAALGFIRSLDGPDVVLVGVENNRQLIEIIEAFGKEIPQGIDFTAFACGDPAMVDPRKWPR